MNKPQLQLNPVALFVFAMVFMVVLNGATAYTVLRITRSDDKQEEPVVPVSKLASIGISEPHAVYLGSFFRVLAYEVASNPDDFATIESCALLISRGGDYAIRNKSGLDYPGLAELVERRTLLDVFGANPVDKKLTADELAAFVAALQSLSDDLKGLAK